MRSLRAQYVSPVMLLAVIVLIGLAIDQAVASLVVGVVLSTAVAFAFALNACRRLASIRPLGTGQSGGAAYIPSIGVLRDEIDDALENVRRYVSSSEHLIRRDAARLAQQGLVLDRMQDGLMRVNAERLIVYANVSAGALFGGRNPAGRSFIVVTRDHEFHQALIRCLEQGGDQQHTLEIPGQNRLIHAVISPLSTDQQEALVILRDITEVNRLQNLRRDFVANVSHELRTPLATMKILTETLLDLRADDDEANRFLGRIDGEIDTMSALVRDLLDLSRLETGGGGLSERLIDATQIVQDVAKRMSSLAQRNDVALRLLEGQPISLVADERRLEQALINLVRNAIDHTPAGGLVEMAVELAGPDVRFSVRDTGSGIAPDDLPRVWERFFKTDRSRSGGGTGLGLAIVKHVAQAHHGTVEARSVLGEGSEFVISIPRQPRVTRRPDSGRPRVTANNDV